MLDPIPIILSGETSDYIPKSVFIEKTKRPPLSDFRREILLVEDDPGVSRYVRSIFEGAGIKVNVAPSAVEGRALFDSLLPQVVVSDLYLGDDTGLSLIKHVKETRPSTYIIILTGQGSIGTTIEAIHSGAFAYLSKPKDLGELENELIPVVERAFKQLESLEKKPKLRKIVDKDSRSIIGKSPSIIEVYQAVAKASLSRGNVIVLGESGTGKELVAHAIHENSRNASSPFVSVNCGALTETLLESELFGHVRGAFTGAIGYKRGLFEEANGGTLFLDEVGDVSLPLQVKLLRAIQEGEIRPVGASEVRKVNVRVIAATHRDLDELVASGKFREDLYYRLKVFLIRVPPLRDRKEDLPDLVNYFIERTGKKNANKVTSISEDSLDLLRQYSWPGNIRELENAIERAAAMANTGTLFPEDFPTEISGVKAEIPEIASAPVIEDAQSIESLERAHIIRTLESVKFNKSRTARILGIDRGTLYRKAHRYGISLGNERH